MLQEFIDGICSVGRSMASILDICGTLSPRVKDYDFLNKTDEELFREDAESLRKDWESVIGKW